MCFISSDGNILKDKMAKIFLQKFKIEKLVNKRSCEHKHNEIDHNIKNGNL